jgi:hypothetical protein
VRFAVLYLRSRRTPAALALVLATTAALWAPGLLVDDPLTKLAFAVLAATIGAAATGSGLAGADLDLDRTAAIGWPPRRAVHVIAATAAVAGALAATTLLGEPLAPVAVMARDVAGLGGLTALGAATVGASRAWIAPVAWAAPTVMLGGPLSGAWYKEVLTWMTQPAGTTSATATAAALATAGLLAYALSGSRR